MFPHIVKNLFIQDSTCSFYLISARLPDTAQVRMTFKIIICVCVCVGCGIVSKTKDDEKKVKSYK